MTPIRSLLLAICLLTALSVPTALSQPVTHDLVMWIRADGTVTVDESGGVVSVVDDSGQGHHATQQAAAERPKLIPAALNGKPVMRFDGTRWLALAGQVLAKPGFSIIAVVTDTRTEGSFHEVISNWTPSNTFSSIFLGTTTVDFAGPDSSRIRFTDDLGGANQGQAGAGIVRHRSTHFVLTGISNSERTTVYQDYLSIAQNPFSITARNYQPPYVIGRQGPISEFWTGDIAEVLVYQTDLSECDLAQTLGYLHAKYGISDCTPQLTESPEDQSACVGGEVKCHTAVSSPICTESLGYQWQIQTAPSTWVDAVDGLLVMGDRRVAILSGSQTSTLKAAGLHPQSDSSYLAFRTRCIAAGACGSATTAPADITVCVGDFDCSGFVDTDDFTAFVLSFEEGVDGADVDGSGFVDTDDFTAFVLAFEAGC